MSDAKKKRAPTPCACCGQDLRVPCPVCLQKVRVLDGHLATHEASRCTGSHMEYRTCPGSEKKAVLPGG